MTHENPTATGGAALAPESATPPANSWHRNLLRTLPNLLVLAAMSAVAYVGHHTDWRFGWPTRGSREFIGQSAVPVTVEDERITINSELAEWCPTHGVAHCPLCFPALAQLDVNPTIDPMQLARIEAALAQLGRSTNASSCSLVHHCVRLDSTDTAEKLGIEVSPAYSADMSEVVSASGETSFDPTRVAHLSSRLGGSAWRVMKRRGQSVQKGEVVALIESGDVGRAKSELHHAIVQLRLKRQALESVRQAPVPEQQRKEAAAALRDIEARVLSAEQALVNMGLDVSAEALVDLPFEVIAQKLQRLGLPRQFAGMSDEAIPGTLLPIASPLDGTVTQCDLIAGEVVEPTRRLFTVADASRLVLTLQVSPVDAVHVKIGQVVHFRPDGATREATTQVSWIGTAAKDRTRTVPVRAELNNDDGRLLASSFGLGRIVRRQEPNAVVVPVEAVQSDSDCQLLFVRDKDFLKPDGPKLFHVRSIRTGARDARNVEVIAGVLPGEVVATKGSDILLNELRRHQNAQVAAAQRTTQKQKLHATRQTGIDHDHRTH